MSLAIVFGWILGLLAGIIPGIGPTILILSTLPIIHIFSLSELIAFYIVLIATSQYYGSVVAISAGVAGEITSGPAVIYGHPLLKEGKGPEALAFTATGSFLGALAGIGILYITSLFYTGATWVYHNTVLTTIYFVVFIGMVFAVSNKKLGFVFLILGFLIGNIGFNPVLLTTVGVKQFSLFGGGVPFYPLFLGFIAIPILWSYYKQRRPVTTQVYYPRIKDRFNLLIKFKFYASALRGTLVGAICGLIPGVSYLISSNLAVTFERTLNSSSNSMSKLISAETANNAGAITVLLPLIFFAIPIVLSEAIILNLAEGKGLGIYTAYSFMADNLYWIILLLLGVSILNWFIAGFWYPTVIRLYKKISNKLYFSATVILTILGGVYAYENFIVWQSLITFALSLIFGFAIKDHESKFPLAIGFFLSDSALNEFYRFYLINLQGVF